MLEVTDADEKRYLINIEHITWINYEAEEINFMGTSSMELSTESFNSLLEYLNPPEVELKPIGEHSR